MKTFRDLKIGDFIYYYDNGQIHKQQIQDIKYFKEENIWYDYFHNKNSKIKKFWHFIVENDYTYDLDEITIDLDYTTFVNGKRYSSLESIHNWLNEMISKTEENISKSETYINKCNILLEKYKKAII